MKKNLISQKDLAQAKTIEQLTAVFEGIASAGITRIRNRTLASQAFFRELWQLYTSLRINPEERLTAQARTSAGGVGIKPQAYVIVTSEGSLSGSLDQQIVDAALATYRPETTDLLVVGSRGATLLADRGIKPAQVFKLPPVDSPGEFLPITRFVGRYPHPTAFYETYQSLAKQSLARIDLITAVRTLGSGEQPGAYISTKDYLFEPSIDELAYLMEGAMMQIALNEIILESHLATYAARFKAMNLAHQKAEKFNRKLSLSANRAKRELADERQSETVTGLRIYATR